MTTLLIVGGVLALVIWLFAGLARGGAHRTRERLEPESGFDPQGTDLSEITVLIPARDEARLIAGTLGALARQGRGLEVLLIDDHSRDDTAEVARAAWASARSPVVDACTLRVLEGAPLAPGWGGKLWALEQGLRLVTREYTLLLDADIELGPGIVAALRDKARHERLDLVSIMATLGCGGFWERLLAPPFVFFFKLIYPFAWVADPGRPTAAAAGGCLLASTAALREVGAFASLHDALIDDCALARRLKSAGRALWLGMSRAVLSRRRYERLGDFWAMVKRTAYTELRYSSALLAAVTLLMLVAFAAPLLALAGEAPARWVGAAALAAMCGVYLPVARFYGLAWPWTISLPVAAVLYLLMTWDSALAYGRGVRAKWKDRRYEVSD